MKLLLTGIDHPNDIRSWSGTPYHLVQSLRKKFDLCFVGGLHGPRALLHTYIEKFHRRLKLPGSYRIRAERAVLKEFARRLDEAIVQEKPDAVVSFSCEPVAYLKPGIPVYLIHDASIRLLAEGYPHFQIMSKRSQRTSEEVQILGFARATLNLATSEWARQSACKDYGVPESRTKVVALGANLTVPPPIDEVSTAIELRAQSSTVHFLFVGVEWARKGGDTAVSIVQALVEKGLDARLHIVGCAAPAAVVQKPFVLAHGFLSKGKPEQAAKLRDLFKTASYFIMPSTGDCSPMVLAEAAAFGLPCISRHVGGIPEIIRSGQTGFLLSDELPEKKLVDLVFELAHDPEQYRQMAFRARNDYETRLNWDAYVNTLKEIIETSRPDPDDRASARQLISV